MNSVKDLSRVALFAVASCLFCSSMEKTELTPKDISDFETSEMIHEGVVFKLNDKIFTLGSTKYTRKDDETFENENSGQPIGANEQQKLNAANEEFKRRAAVAHAAIHFSVPGEAVYFSDASQKSAFLENPKKQYLDAIKKANDECKLALPKGSQPEVTSVVDAIKNKKIVTADAAKKFLDIVVPLNASELCKSGEGTTGEPKEKGWSNLYFTFAIIGSVIGGGLFVGVVLPMLSSRA